MKRSSQILPLAILAASVNAQNTDTTTIFYSTCPTAVETTITLSSTLTYCPGDNCGGGPVITPAPGAGNSGLGTEIINYTTTGADGSTTVYQEFETVYHQPCSTCPSGLIPQTFTITEECPCMSAHPSTYIPPGFTTSAYACDVCDENGGPSTVTVTMPCSTGPYANQATATGGGTGAGAGAPGANANSAAGPGATGTGAGSPGSPGTGATGAAATGTGATGGYAPGQAGTTANDVAPAPTYGPGSNSTVNPPITPVAPGGTAGSGTEFKGAASQLLTTRSATLALLVGVAAWLL